MASPVHHAVIPAAGLGTRFLPATKSVPKEMLPVIDTPAIQYVVEEAVRAGIEDILVITGRGKEAIEDHFDRSIELEHALDAAGKHEELGTVRRIADLAAVHFVRQGDPHGLGHAVGVARRHVGENPFVVLLPDDIFDERYPVVEQMVRTFGERDGSVIALKRFPPEEISSYGAADVEPVEGDVVRLRGVVEKPAPEDAPSDLAVMGRYIFTPEIFDAIERTRPGKGGEIQLTDAIGLLLTEQPVYGLVFEEGRYDIGQKLEYLRATVELALARDDLGPAFEAYLRDLLKQE
jgi:UTP--glucose-1-phosphate uridylyltransferase